MMGPATDCALVGGKLRFDGQERWLREGEEEMAFKRSCENEEETTIQWMRKGKGGREGGVG